MTGEATRAAAPAGARLAEVPPGVTTVFVDVFDTILLRRVHPEDCKKLAARWAWDALGLPGPEPIYAARQALERERCLANQAAGHDDEFRFDEGFAAELQRRIPAARTVDPAAFHQLLVDAELQTESAVTYPDEPLVEWLRGLARGGVTLYAVSDFYWPKPLLASLLARHGLADLFTDVFVSSDALVTKRSGRQFDRVLAALRLRPAEVLMVGDNEHSDGAMARERGLHTRLLDRAAQRRFYERAKARADASSVTSELQSILAGDEGTVFPEMALTLYAFIEALEARLAAGHVREVFFLAREGEFLKTLYDRYAAAHALRGRFAVRSEYLYVSRKSTFAASLDPLPDERLETLFRQYRKLSIGELLANLGFDDAAAREVADAAGVSLAHRPPDLPTSASYAVLRATPLFRARYEAVRAEQKRLLDGYLRQLGARYDAGVHVVDVGWKGTIQDHLFRALGRRAPFSGWYVGLVGHGAAGPGNQKAGLLFDATASSPFATVYNENRSLFEVLLGASHGSTERYREAGGVVEPELARIAAEEQLFAAHIRPVQERLAGLFDRILEVLAASPVRLADHPELVARLHGRMTLLARRPELDFFAALTHQENFGTLGESRFDRPTPPSVLARAKELREFIRDARGALEQSWWPLLTVHHLGVPGLARAYGHWRFQQLFGTPTP